MKCDLEKLRLNKNACQNNTQKNYQPANKKDNWKLFFINKYEDQICR